jgi:hypothetical protein
MHTKLMPKLKYNRKLAIKLSTTVPKEVKESLYSEYKTDVGFTQLLKSLFQSR